MSGANIFISYAGEDIKEAAPLIRRLQEAGNSVFAFQYTPALPGTEFTAHVFQHLAMSHFVILLWTAHAAASPWVALEIAEARRLQRVIIPVLFDAQMPPPAGCELTQSILAYHDRSGWTYSVSDGVQRIVEVWANQQALLASQARQAQAAAAARAKAERSSTFAKIAGGVIGVGVLAALAGAFSSDEGTK
jgi:hypothetical protein